MRRAENFSLALVSFVGLAVFGLPFVVSSATSSSSSSGARSLDSFLLLAFVCGCSLLVAIGEVARGSSAESLSRSVALLGALVAIDASLRMIPSFVGASPIFALIILVGAVFGPRFGFVMGSLTLLVSAAISAGIGPWLPFQMLCAGWVGMAAGWLPHMTRASTRIATTAAYGAVAGIGYGAIMNLYSWPFAAPGLESDVGLYWHPGLTAVESIQRYGAFYGATSLVHDLTRSGANAVLVVFAGTPLLRLLERFRVRTSWKSTNG